MYRSNMKLNRKVLADMAITEPLSFKSVITIVGGSLDEKHSERLAKKAERIAARRKDIEIIDSPTITVN